MDLYVRYKDLSVLIINAQQDFIALMEHLRQILSEMTQLFARIHVPLEHFALAVLGILTLMKEISCMLSLVKRVFSVNRPQLVQKEVVFVPQDLLVLEEQQHHSQQHRVL